MGIREKRRITELLGSADLECIIEELKLLPASRVVNPLIGALCSNDETVRWHAIAALGPIVSDLADRDLEAARVIMRRLMWSLNDESGGIGWGAPEAMGEIMASNKILAGDYAHILVAFMRQDGFFLELEMLQRGLMWGLGRLAQVRPELLRAKNATSYLLPYLDADDATVRGLAAQALGLLKAREAIDALNKLRSDAHPVRYYSNRSFTNHTVGQLAEKALADIRD
jgi:HEAT repeat protein